MKVSEALKILQELDPDTEIEGEWTIEKERPPRLELLPERELLIEIATDLREIKRWLRNRKVTLYDYYDGQEYPV
jgi:hypothetical protein